MPDFGSYLGTESMSQDESESTFENKSGLAEDLKFLASMPELCDVTFLVGETREPVCAVKVWNVAFHLFSIHFQLFPSHSRLSFLHDHEFFTNFYTSRLRPRGKTQIHLQHVKTNYACSLNVHQNRF